MKGGYSVAQMIMGWCFDDFNENNIFYHLSQPFKYQCSFQESCARSSPVPSDLLSTMQSGSNLCRTITSFRIHPRKKKQQPESAKKWRTPILSKITLLGSNISPTKALLKMIFLFPRWDMLVSWRVQGQQKWDTNIWWKVPPHLPAAAQLDKKTWDTQTKTGRIK